MGAGIATSRVTTPVPVPDVAAVSDLERRAARAELLLSAAPAAPEPLRFAAGLYRIQAAVAHAVADAHAIEPLTGHLDQDADRLLEQASRVVRYAAEEGPEVLSEQAEQRRKDLASTAKTRLLVFWKGDQSSFDDYLSRAILRPYVEVLRGLPIAPDRVHRQGQCPFCGGAPWVGARRDGGQMEGAKRMLVCALCGGEWLFGRILCPGCLEEDPRKLPIFQSEKYPGIRLETCESCHRYVKSIDLSEDNRPIPEVDDLISISMDLWASEEGFTRIEPGLAGL